MPARACLRVPHDRLQRGDQSVDIVERVAEPEADAHEARGVVVVVDREPALHGAPLGVAEPE